MASPSSSNQSFANEHLGSILGDLRWLHEQFNQGKLNDYEGEYVAVYNQRVVAHDRKYHKARNKAAKAVSGIAPERFAVEFVEKLD